MICYTIVYMSFLLVKIFKKKKKSERRKLLIKINYLCEIIFSLICEQMK